MKSRSHGDASGFFVRNMRGAGLVGDAGVGGVLAEGGGEGVEVVSLVAEDLAEVFAEGELVEFVDLADAAAVVADGLLFVLQVEAEHVGGLFAGLDGLGGDGRVSAEEIDPVTELEGVVEFLLGVDFELAGNVHVGCAFEALGVVDVGDDGLEFTLKIFVEEIDELFFGDGGVFLLSWHGRADLAFG